VADPIAFIDLQAQRRRLGAPLNAAIAAAVEGGQWVLGPQVAQFEQDIAAWAGVKHAVGCANGTDALLLVLRAWEVGPGDAVFVPAFTFAASAEVVVLAGASPVFVDVLSEVSERTSCSSNTDLLRLYEKWLKTGSPRSGQLLVDPGPMALDNGALDHPPSHKEGKYR